MIEETTNDKIIRKKISKKNKIIIGVISIIIITCGCLIWYYYPRFLTESEKNNKIVEINHYKGIDKAYNFIDRAYDSDKDRENHKIALKQMVENEKTLPDGSQMNGIKIMKVSMDEDNYSDYTDISTIVKNIGYSDTNYIKYNIYFYSDYNCNGNIIGTEWSNCDKPIPPGALTKMEASVKKPYGTKSYKVVLDEVQ